ncbi:MAG: hypothetical protein ACYCWE_21630 [Eubacteriales bacterium]
MEIDAVVAELNEITERSKRINIRYTFTYACKYRLAARMIYQGWNFRRNLLLFNGRSTL